MPRRNFLIVLLILTFGLAAKSQQPPSPLQESFQSYQKLKQESVYGLEWVSVGPVLNSARVEAVQSDPTRPEVIYVAFGSGNLWKTINHGVSWRPLFENQASHGIGDFALAPSDSNVIYLGTGESLKKARNFTIPGTGVYRSDDGGENWRHLGLSDSWHIGEISVHPENPDIAIVAVLGHFWSSNPNRGLFRTDDGGQTWNHVLSVDEKTGANDVVFSPSDPDIVYASTWENYPGVSGANSAVHKSEDGGITWKKCDQGLPAGDQIGRIGLAVSYSDPNKVYALVDNRERIKQNSAAQVYRSLDGGRNWKLTHQDDLMIFSRIGWYFADIYVNPLNDEEIFGLGVRVARSRDGGKSFDLVAGAVTHRVPNPAATLHLDHCEMWIHPANPNHIVLGNDGGLYRSLDGGSTWEHFNNLPTGEFYDIAVDQNSPYQIYAGAQDNATVYGPAKERVQDNVDHWKYLWIDPWNGGDGCVTQVDPNDSNTVYFSAQEGAFRRKDMTTNRSAGIRAALPKGHPGKLEFNFVAPMIISPHDSKTLYLAGNYVFKSTNRGDDWTVISPNIADSADPKRRSTAAGTIAESPLVPGLLYLGTDKGAFWVSDDGGGKWKEFSVGLPTGYVRGIFPSQFVDSRVYLAVTGLNYDDLNTYLFCSDDRGATWTSISANLSNEPANVIIEDPFHEEILYAGTFRGVYLSTDRGESWSMLGNNLSACSIADLEIHRSTRDLIVATHGRGIYVTNLTPIHESHINKLVAGTNDYLFPIPTARRPYLSDVRPTMNYREFEKTPISYWLINAGDVKLSVHDQNDKLLASFQLAGKQGLNQFRWDLVIKSTENDSPYFINYKTHLDVGSYLVRIESQNGPALEGKLDVVNDESE